MWNKHQPWPYILSLTLSHTTLAITRRFYFQTVIEQNTTYYRMSIGIIRIAIHNYNVLLKTRLYYNLNGTVERTIEQWLLFYW